MIKVLKTLRDILCLIGLLMLTKYAYDYYQVRQESQKPTTTEQALSVAKRSSNAVVDIVSGGFIKLGNITRKARFKNASVQTESFGPSDQRQDSLADLGQQAEFAYKYLKQDNTTDEHEKNQLMGRVKEVISQIEHIDKYIQKGAPVDVELAGPAGQASKTVYERTIERKSLALVNKMETLLTDIASEMSGHTLESTTSTTIAAGIAHNNELLQELVS
jgi:hypothetical protein